MAIQTDEYGQPVLDDQGNPVQIAAPAPAPATAAPPMLVNRGGQQYQGAPVQPPAGQGRMYMGPAMSQADESAFMLSPAGTRTNAMPPPTPEQAAGADQRVAQATGGEANSTALARMQRVDAPGSRTIGVNNAPMPDPSEEVMQLAQRMGVPLNQATAAVEAQKRYQAQRGYQADLAKGMSAEQAMTKWGPLLLGSKSAMTPYQQSQTKMRQQQLDQQAARANKVVPAKPDPVLGRERLEIEKSLNKLNGDIVAGRVASRVKSNGKPDPKWPAVEAELKRLNDRLQQLQAPTAPAGTATGTMPSPAAAAPVRPPVAAPAATAKPASPFREGQVVRSKKDGKTYKIVNGEPVPVNQ